MTARERSSRAIARLHLRRSCFSCGGDVLTAEPGVRIWAHFALCPVCATDPTMVAYLDACSAASEAPISVEPGVRELRETLNEIRSLDRDLDRVAGIFGVVAIAGLAIFLVGLLGWWLS